MNKLYGWIAGALMMTSLGAMAGEILLGPGDVVKMSVYGSPDLALETRINEAGVITFPLVGQVGIGGLSTTAAEQKLAALLERGGFLRKAQVNIMVTVQTSHQVSVLGQVNRPGRYPVDGPRTVMDLLAQAGGIGVDGSEAVTLIRKRNGVTSKESIDIVKMVRSGALERDLDVESNDIIYVERAPRVYIYGEVQRPGQLRLERSMTVVQALSAGGGLSARGTERDIRIKRRDASGKLQVIKAKQDDELQNDDVVYVSESWF